MHALIARGEENRGHQERATETLAVKTELSGCSKRRLSVHETHVSHDYPSGHLAVDGLRILKQ